MNETVRCMFRKVGTKVRMARFFLGVAFSLSVCYLWISSVKSIFIQMIYSNFSHTLIHSSFGLGLHSALFILRSKSAPFSLVHLSTFSTLFGRHGVDARKQDNRIHRNFIVLYIFFIPNKIIRLQIEKRIAYSMIWVCY